MSHGTGKEAQNFYPTHATVGEALESAVAISNRDEAERWVGRDGNGYFVCAYAASPEGADSVCVVSGIAALSKLWNRSDAEELERCAGGVSSPDPWESHFLKYPATEAKLLRPAARTPRREPLPPAPDRGPRDPPAPEGR